MRGIEVSDQKYLLCYSLCCRTPGCRKRFRVPSVRFLSRHTFSGIFLVLVPALFKLLNKNAWPSITDLAIGPRMLKGWFKWWQSFSHSKFWQYYRGNYGGELRLLPQDLVLAYGIDLGNDLVMSQENIIKLLKFLSGFRIFDNSS